jgi:cobalt-zinc-cadmium resistance protein CzcA
VGSQIRGTKITEVLPVTVVDKEDIIATAAVSGDDLFRSIPQALLVLANVPFALVGGIAALWVRQLNLNLSASIGFIALFGIAVLNGVVLVEHLNHLRQAHDDEQKSVLDRIVQGAADRLRPVLMTALVASLGFVPMALSTSPGSEVQRPLASVVIGGLITSTVLTLFVLPVLYGWLEQRREARLARRGRAAPAAGLPA